MTSEDKVKHAVIKNFGVAYRAFGLSKLMGHIIALLIYSPEPVSLEEIAKSLHRSKGPVSQILRRLRDKDLVRRVWQPTSRKDFYEISPDIFERAFRNNFELIKSNTRLANQLRHLAEKEKSPKLETLKARMVEMETFYEIMEKHHENFLKEWSKAKIKLMS